MKPTQMQTFDALYVLASRDGRDERLFGNSIELARPAYERSLLGKGYPSAYLEFPLMGEPGFDLLTVHGTVEPGDSFAPGAGFGYQPLFDWFAGIEKLGAISCGIEVDTGDGETERAGAYLQYRRRSELVAPFLQVVGESRRTEGYLDLCARMPSGWPPSYVGLFPGRAGTPLRIGGYMDVEAKEACVKDPQELAAAFETIGFSAYDNQMLARCSKFMQLAPSVDFQFDIMEDGGIGDTFGLSLSFNDTTPRKAYECMSNGYGARIMELLQDWHLADERWKLIANCAFARHVPFSDEDGHERRLALIIRFNYAKVKFTRGVAQPAKFYLVLTSGELEA